MSSPYLAAISPSRPAPINTPLPRFLLTHLGLPMALAALSAILLLHGGDQAWTRLLYTLQGNQWALREHWLTEGVIHRGGRWLSLFAALSLLGCYAHGMHRPDRSHLRLPLLYLLLAVIAGTSCVSALKSVTGLDCPWDLVDYGGRQTYHSLLQAVPASQSPGRCFPAGHASAGYAWVTLYFTARLLGKPRWAWTGLAVGLGAGLVFGLGQQLRGAHFASHDLASLSVCWCVSLTLYLLFQPQRLKHRLEPQGT